ncbi:MAG: thioredoxin family protein [Lutibacter sp.]|uniref:thioredoxin family protein n=1 Tax=Lutibacter sp. TaxID=1925666 RepID=UPI00183BAD77|nr:thioredoxin family protein [Lutibacter sp.]MBT8318476.1 TM0996/MTH895 family glutaredoxin-like protein [Lutibacter sp.]NNJ59334.1 thioredoxin family protein [Lutibacter sp.]
MKTIKILGTGCPNCVTTEKIVTEVVNELNIDATIVKVTDIQEIMMYDIMSTPAVVIDEQVVIKGKVPSKNEIQAFLVDNFANNACCSDDNIESSCCSSEDKESGCC